MSEQDEKIGRPLLIAACVLCGGVGVLVGVLLCMPLIPYTVPESYAALLGAALGSIITVGGAWWLATNKERHERAEGRALIRKELWAFRTEFAQTLSDLGPALDQGQEGDHLDRAQERLQAVGNQAIAAMGSIDDLRPVFASLGPHGPLCRAGLTRAVSDTKKRIDSVLERGIGFAVDEDEPLRRNLVEIDRHLGRL
jgi:hypothetical protein